MKEITIEAKVDNLDQVLSFVDEQLESAGCSIGIQTQIDIAVEEVFVNIAQYAYDPNVTQSADERPIGGLGIYMVKNIMDDVEYEHKDGQNIFTIAKNIE